LGRGAGPIHRKGGKLNRRVQGISTVIALLVAAVVAVGCGSSSSSSGLSKQQLASKTNAICNKYKEKIAAVKQPSDLLSNHVSAAHYFDQIAPLYDQAIAELNKLKPASSVQAQWSQLVSRFGALANLVDQLKTKADHADPSGTALLSQVRPLTNSANAAADGIGATDCAKAA
jgi:hypothetical protein